jgi:hypothetical protein
VWHTIKTTQVATVSNRKPQIVDWPTMVVN